MERVNTTEASVNDAIKKVPDKLLRIFDKSLQRTGGNLAPDQSQIFAPLRERFSREILKSSTGERLNQFSEILNAIYTDNPTFSATIPILLWCFGARSPELIGSGVVVRVNGLTFLLTAAHVTDYKNKGTYFTTSQQGYTQISGQFTKLVPVSERSVDDKLDVSYLELDKNCLEGLDSDCEIIGKKDMYFEVEPPLRNTYTFAGFPWRKSKVKERSIKTKFLTLSGQEIKSGEYDALGLTRTRHIAIRFNCKQTFSIVSNRLIVSPLPEGMSGGGVYLWNEEAMKTWPVRLPLAGIVNKFISDKSLLIATRLRVYIQSIVR